MKVPKRLALCCAAIFLCTAQTPQPTPPPVVAVPFKAARHLEYSFEVSYYTNGEGHSSGLTGSGGTSDSGVSSMFGGGGRRGTIVADITAATSDGGLLVGVNEEIQNERPSERFTCIVYGDGHTYCPGEVRPLSDAENTLLSFLGRGFIDSSKMDANNHWQRAYKGKDISVVDDFTASDPGNGKTVNVVESKKVSSNVPSVGNTAAELKIVYDTTMSVPDSVHDEAHEAFANGTVQITMDLQLTKDSFATHQ